jgi:hypothetical protein
MKKLQSILIKNIKIKYPSIKEYSKKKISFENYENGFYKKEQTETTTKEEKEKIKFPLNRKEKLLQLMFKSDLDENYSSNYL